MCTTVKKNGINLLFYPIQLEPSFHLAFFYYVYQAMSDKKRDRPYGKRSVPFVFRLPDKTYTVN